MGRNGVEGGSDIDRRERKLRNLRSLTRFCVQARLVVEPLAGYSAFSSFFLVASVFTPTPPATTEAHKVSCSRLSTFHVAQVTISPWTKIRSSNEYKAIRAFFPSLESTHFFATILHQRWKVSPSIIVIPFRQGVPARSIETNQILDSFYVMHITCSFLFSAEYTMIDIWKAVYSLVFREN